MARRQDPSTPLSPSAARARPSGTGRTAQVRRTRRAIVTAARDLLASGGPPPTIDAIAAEADVSRRTVYVHFPTLDQLLLDATLGALSDAYLDSRLEQADAGFDAGSDVHTRVQALVDAVFDDADTTLPLGRRLIHLTVDTSADTSAETSTDTSTDTSADTARTTSTESGPRRGHRRTTWLEAVIEPVADVLRPEQRERLISGLSLVIGFEAMIVLRDIRGLDPAAEKRTAAWAAHALVDAMLAEAGVNDAARTPPEGRS